MSDLPFIPPRPPTPQAMLHRLPDKSEDDTSQNTPPSKYIILITGSTAVAGKVQIATSVSKALSCPLFQGDSLHESSAKAASLGTSRAGTGPGTGSDASGSGASGPNEARYQRMWLSKMTRTGLLFPDESRPANQGFSGFGGGASSSSTSTSRRGSASSVASASSDAAASDASSMSMSMGNVAGPGAQGPSYVNRPTFALPEQEVLRRGNPALMVLTHPELERWHKVCIKKTVGEYGVGVLFVPLYDDDDFPQLRVLDPRMMTSFASFGSGFGTPQAATSSSSSGLTADDVLRVDIDGDVEAITEEIVQGARDAMGIRS
ncbi:hypothetical protein SLS62_006020 [Diatrype stigma]|uniref:Uncharacterized protein n=1 Tax=Diatrype stigma TaxID=117547 RepID=A0AAN9UNT1_9PEZI